MRVVLNDPWFHSRTTTGQLWHGKVSWLFLLSHFGFYQVPFKYECDRQRHIHIHIHTLHRQPKRTLKLAHVGHCRRNFSCLFLGGKANTNNKRTIPKILRESTSLEESSLYYNNNNNNDIKSTHVDDDNNNDDDADLLSGRIGNGESMSLLQCL